MSETTQGGGSKKGMKRFLTGTAVFILLLAAAWATYTVHMRYDIEPHVSYNIEDTGSEPGEA